MPIYQYECMLCGQSGFVEQKISDKPLEHCTDLSAELLTDEDFFENTSCPGIVRRIPQVPGIAFKGSGFHVNDYRRD